MQVKLERYLVLKSNRMNPVEIVRNKLLQGDKRSVVVKKNIFASMALKVLSIVTSFLLVPLTINYVSSELYGVWLTLSSILTWIGFMDIGFSQGLKNKLTEAIAKEDWIRGRSLVTTTYCMMIFIIVPVCVVLELFIPHINWTKLLNVNPIYADDIVRAMYACIAFTCLQMIVRVFVSVVAAFQKVALSESFGVIGNILSLVIIAILTRICPPSLVILACTLAAMPILVTLVASIIFFSGRFKQVAPNLHYFRKEYVKDLFGLGYKFFIINIQVLVLFQSTNFLISYVSSPNEVTTYNIAYRLLNCGMMLYTMITSPLWPAYTDAYTRGDYAWMKSMRNKMSKILLLSILACILITILSPFIYKVWIGNATHVPFLMTSLVCLYVATYCWSSLNGTLLVGMGKIKVNTRMCIVGMVLHIPMSLLLGQILGAYGVVMSMIGINLFYAVMQQYQVSLLIEKKAVGIWDE